MAGDLEELVEVVLDLAGPLQSRLLEDSPEVRFVQKKVKDELNRRRKERAEKPLGHPGFARLRREAGVEDSWIRRPGNRIEWALPQAYLSNIANLPNLPEPLGQASDGVSKVDNVSKGVPAPDKPLPVRIMEVLTREKDPVAASFIAAQAGGDQDVVEKWLEKWRVEEGTVLEWDGLWKRAG